jgi:tetratricopeptide (TPR) repeat protein
MDAVREIENLETLPNDRPVYDARIVAARALKEGEDSGMGAFVDPEDPYPSYPQDMPKSMIEGEVARVDELIKIAAIIKDRGNVLYKDKNLEEAIKKYRKAVRYIESADFPSAAEYKQLDGAKIPILTNLAACYLALKRYVEVCSVCSSVLELDSSNVKALSRRGQAYLSSKNYEDAVSDFRRALEHTPDDALLKKHYSAAVSKLSQVRDRQRRAFANLSFEE